MKYGTIIDSEAMKAAGLTADALELSKQAYRAMGGSGGESPDEDCIKRINGMKDEYGVGLSTSITIYNALGLALSLRSIHNEQGRVWKYACDDKIYNGEWSCVLHVKPDLQAIGSHGAITYDLVGAKAVYNEEIVLVFAWDNPYTGGNKASCWFTNPNYWKSRTGRQLWETSTHGSESSRSDYGVLSVHWTIGQGTSPIFRVVAARGECL